MFEIAMPEPSPSRPHRTPSGSPSPSETPDLCPSPKRGINPPTNDAWGVEAATAPSYRTKSFAPNPHFVPRSANRYQGSRELSVEEHIDETIRLFSSAGPKTPDKQHGLPSAFGTPGGQTTKAEHRERTNGGGETLTVGVGMTIPPESSPPSRRNMKQRPKLYNDQGGRAPTLQDYDLRHQDEEEPKPKKIALPHMKERLAAPVQQEHAEREPLESPLNQEQPTKELWSIEDLQGHMGRPSMKRLPETRDQQPHPVSQKGDPGSVITRRVEADSYLTIPSTTLESAMSVLIDRVTTKLTIRRHKTLDTRVVMENKWAAEDAEWARLQKRRQSQLWQKSRDHRELMELRARELTAARDLHFVLNLRDEVHASLTEPSALTTPPRIDAPAGSSPTTVALYENAREAAQRGFQLKIGQLHRGDSDRPPAKVPRALNEGIFQDKGRRGNQNLKEAAHELVTAQKPAEWEPVQDGHVSGMQSKTKEGAWGKAEPRTEEHPIMDQEVQSKTINVKSEGIIAAQDADGGTTIHVRVASRESPQPLVSDYTLCNTPVGNEQNQSDDDFAPPTPSPKPRRLDPNAARFRDFNIGDNIFVQPTSARPKIPVTPRGPQSFFGSFLFNPSVGRPRLSPEQILDKYEASLEEPGTVVKKSKKWDLFARPIPVLLPTNFGKSGRGSSRPEVPITRSVEYKMTLPDLPAREGQTPDDLRMERDHMERYLKNNGIPFESQKDVQQQRHEQAEEISRAKLTGGRSRTRSPSRERARVVSTESRSTRTASSTDKPVTKLLDTARQLFTAHAGSSVPAKTQSFLGRRPTVFASSTTQSPNTADSFSSPPKTTLAGGSLFYSPTKQSSGLPRPSSSPPKGNRLPPHSPSSVPLPNCKMVSTRGLEKPSPNTPLHSALTATRLSPTKTPAANPKSPSKDPLKVELAELKFRLQKVEIWSKGVKQQMQISGLEQEWELLQRVTKSRVVGAGGGIGASFADWDVEMKLSEGLEKDD